MREDPQSIMATAKMSPLFTAFISIRYILCIPLFSLLHYLDPYGTAVEYPSTFQYLSGKNEMLDIGHKPGVIKHSPMTATLYWQKVPGLQIHVKLEGRGHTTSHSTAGGLRVAVCVRSGGLLTATRNTALKGRAEYLKIPQVQSSP